MSDLFKTRILSGAINAMKPAPTRVLDRIFPRKKRSLSENIRFVVKTNSEGILANISAYAAAVVDDGPGRKIITVTAPRFAKKRFISAADLREIASFGKVQEPELLKERIADEQADMKTQVDTTREFMACKALGGQVVDKDGKVLVDYNFSSAQKPVLGTTAKWTHADSDPVKDIRSWKKRIEQEVGGVTAFVALCGSETMDALLNNVKVRDLLKYTSGSQLAESGRIAQLAGVEIEEYNGSYVKKTGAREDLIPAKGFVLVGLTSDGAAEYYTPVVDFKAPTGVGTGKAPALFFSKSWEVEDPSGRWLKVESRPLPVLHRPGAVTTVTVV